VIGTCGECGSTVVLVLRVTRSGSSCGRAERAGGRTNQCVGKREVDGERGVCCMSHAMRSSCV
jgi:hypothetical protein